MSGSGTAPTPSAMKDKLSQLLVQVSQRVSVLNLNF